MPGRSQTLTLGENDDLPHRHMQALGDARTADRLRATIGAPDAVVAPWYRRQIRVGRQRERQVKQEPVVGGVLFIAEDAIDAAKRPGGICSCRSQAAATGGVVQMLTPERDPVTGDRGYAKVGVHEIAPLIEYAEARDRLFDERSRGKRPVIDDAEARAALLGKRVTLTGGLLAAVSGVVAGVARGMATITLDTGMFGSSITVPIDLVRVAE